MLIMLSPIPSLELEQQLIDDREKVKIAGWGDTYDFSVKSLYLMETEAPLVRITSALRLGLTVSRLKPPPCCVPDMKMKEQTHVMETVEDPLRFVTMVKNF